MASKPVERQEKPRRGCWTCKDRRVACDRQVPGCSNCARSGRKCLGYGMRLSWPRNGDPKRAIVAMPNPRPPPAQRAARRRSTASLALIHTSSRDIDMYHYLREPRNRPCERQPARLVFPPPPLPWSPGNPDSKALELVDHFSVSYSTLPVLGVDPGRLRDLLVHMALSGSGLPAFALKSSLLAVSSLHRDGLQDLALRHKIAAINALAESAESGPPGALESAQHAAACVLLATFEIQHQSESSGQWVFYVGGAKHIVQTAGLDERSDQAELHPLLDWIYYLDVMSRFVTRHWRHPSTLPHSTMDKVAPKASKSRGKRALSPNRTSSARDVLGLMAAASDLLVEPHDPRARSTGYQSQLRSLEGALLSEPVLEAAATESEPEDGATTQLYRLATLVYLGCGSASPCVRDGRLEAVLDRGFHLIRRLGTCERSLPLMLLGSEARNDEERMVLLELVHRSEAGHNAGTLMRLRTGLAMVWSQRDLEADEEAYSELSYLYMLDTVISSACTLPFFS